MSITTSQYCDVNPKKQIMPETKKMHGHENDRKEEMNKAKKPSNEKGRTENHKSGVAMNTMNTNREGNRGK